MTTTKKRGRPRRLDPEKAAETAMKLFWEQGYETVGIADLTKAMGINPPSLYSAFGNKAGVLEKAIEVYQKQSSAQFLPAFKAATASDFFRLLLQVAAKAYSADPKLKGCLVLDGATNTADTAARKIAKEYRNKVRDQIENTLTALNVEGADIHAEACITAMIGLSGAARHGVPKEKLEKIAEMFSEGLSDAIGPNGPK